MDGSTINPYPFARLEKLTQEEIDLLDELRWHSAPWIGLAEALERVVPGPVSADLAQLDIATGAQVREQVGAGWFAALVDASGSVVGFVSLDVGLAQALAGVALAGEVPPAPELRPLLPAEEAALGLVSELLLDGADLPLRPIAGALDRLDDFGQARLSAVKLRVSLGPVRGWLSGWMLPDRWSRIAHPDRADRRKELERLQRSPLWSAFGREVRLVIGSFSAERAALLALGPGDVLLPAAWAGHDRPESGRLLFGDAAVAEVTLSWREGIGFRMAESAGTGEDRVSEHDENQPDLSKATTLRQMRPVVADRLEVLEIVVGSQTMTLSELLGLRPGAVVTLAERLDAPVDLVVEGRTIGRGELVEVEGRLGVRILALGADAPR